MRLELNWRAEDGQRLPLALWHPGPGYRMISTGVLGGGLGAREWVLNAQVPAAYARTDPAAHLRELARDLGLTGPGVGLLPGPPPTPCASPRPLIPVGNRSSPARALSGGPRIARAVHAAVRTGAVGYAATLNGRTQ